MKKIIYEAPTAQTVRLEAVDVITESLREYEDPNIIPDGWMPV